MFPTWTYAKSDAGIYVNMFVGSRIGLENINGTDVEMVQSTEYPWNGKVKITVNPKARKNFTVFVRSPNRGVSKLYANAPEADGISSLTVNGAAARPMVRNGYAAIQREWKAGDTIEFTLPLKVQRVRAIEQVAADRGKVALRFGPLMYNIEKVDQDIAKTLAKDSPLTTKWRGDLLGGVMTINGSFDDGSPMLAIPNYARMNREAGPPPPPATFDDNGARPAPRPPVSSVWIKEG
jgi:DUF1680 family protein